MPRVRDVASLLVGLGEVKATQRGAVVDPLTVTGPIRLTALPGTPTLGI